jgi:hypothetical protein
MFRIRHCEKINIRTQCIAKKAFRNMAERKLSLSGIKKKYWERRKKEQQMARKSAALSESKLPL